MTKSKIKYSCIILAGGKGRRVGGRDKGLIEYNNKPLIQHVIDAIEPQADEIIISANRNIDTYKAYGYSVVSDDANNYMGPLAGIAAALPLCQNDWVFITPCDMPFLPSDIIGKLSEQMTNSNLCIAKVADRLQLVLLVNKNLLPSILQALQDSQLRLMQWVASQKPITHSFSDAESHLFKNFNDTNNLISSP